MKRANILGSAIVISAVLLLAGCPFQSPDQAARRLVGGEYGFLVQAQKNHHDDCVAHPTKPLCVAINKAGAQLNLLIDAINTYCSGAAKPGQQAYADGGPCSPVKSYEEGLRAAVSNLKTLIADVKFELAKGGP